MNYINYIGALLLAAASCAACDKDSNAPHTLKLAPAVDELSFTAEKNGQTFILTSDYPAWHIELAYAEDAEWIDIWPKVGDYDGRFSVTVSANASAYLRSSVVTIYAAGYPVRQIPVRQVGRAFALTINVPNNLKTVTAQEQLLEIVVTSTGTWRAEVTAGASWLTIGENQPTRQNIGVQANATGTLREGVVHFVIPGTEVSLDLHIKQTAN